MTANEIFASAVFAAGLVATPVAAAELDVIVDRTGHSVNVFFGMTADDIAPVFAVSSDSLLRDEAGLLRLDDFQSNGSFADADRLIAPTVLQINGEAADFQAMSMMVHPLDIHVPFETPIDGWIAMSVCGVPPTFADASNDAVRVYAGFNAYPVDGLGALSFDFAGDAEMSVALWEYQEGELLQHDVVQITNGQPLVLPAVAASQSWASWGPGFAGVLALIGLGLIVRGNRRLPRTKSIAEA
ncbi:MAG: hypothetical protein AAFU41_10575 [Pseudomonadota bacterium]